MFLAEQTDGIEYVFVALRLDQPARQLGFELRFVGQRAEKTRLDQRIDQVRALRQNIGEARRHAEDQSDETDELGILPQQRQEQATGAQPGQKAIEGGEGSVRIFGTRELLDDQRQELDDIVARLLAAQRPVFPRPPAAHRGRDLLRLPKTQDRQPIERIALDVGADEREVLLLGKEGRRALEQPYIVLLNLVQMDQQGVGESVAILETEKAREFAERRAIGRQGVGLLVGHHLQAMLDAAQEVISRGERIARLGIDPAAVGERRERGDRLAAAQFAVSAAGDELLGLGKKLDLADAAAAELDVMTLHCDLAVAAIGVDLLLHRVHVGDGGVVEVFAPNERGKLADERFAGGKIAGARPRLDQRGALPVLATALVVVECRCGGDRDLGRGRIGAKPQIDTEHVTVGRALLQKLDQVAGQPHVKADRIEVRRKPGEVRIEKDHQIDVAGKIQLVSAHLAHGEHDIAGVLLRMAFVGGHELATAQGVAKQMIDRGTKRHVGHVGERARHPRHRPYAADIGQCDEERRLRLHAAQHAHQHRLGARRGGTTLRVGEQRGERAIWIARDEVCKARRIGTNEIPQIGRGFGDARQKVAQQRTLDSQRRKRLAGGAGFDFGKPRRDARGSCRGRQRQRAGEAPDQCRFVKFFPGPLFDRGPAHAVPAGPARGSAIVLRRPG